MSSDDKYILSIDQGTTGTTVILVDSNGKTVGKNYKEITQIFPKPGWVEHKPDEIDLRFIEPIASGLVNVPGEQGTFTQNGTEYDGIMPYRTYYYILTPLDSVGNEFTLIDYPSQNVERVHIEDQYWQYNEYKIPEPPPPTQWVPDGPGVTVVGAVLGSLNVVGN